MRQCRCGTMLEYTTTINQTRNNEFQATRRLMDSKIRTCGIPRHNATGGRQEGSWGRSWTWRLAGGRVGWLRLESANDPRVYVVGRVLSDPAPTRTARHRRRGRQRRVRCGVGTDRGHRRCRVRIRPQPRADGAHAVLPAPRDGWVAALEMATSTLPVRTRLVGQLPSALRMMRITKRQQIESGEPSSDRRCTHGRQAEKPQYSRTRLWLPLSILAWCLLLARTRNLALSAEETRQALFLLRFPALCELRAREFVGIGLLRLLGLLCVWVLRGGRGLSGEHEAILVEGVVWEDR